MSPVSGLALALRPAWRLACVGGALWLSRLFTAAAIEVTARTSLTYAGLS